jgi:hypothetical protein
MAEWRLPDGPVVPSRVGRCAARARRPPSARGQGVDAVKWLKVQRRNAMYRIVDADSGSIALDEYGGPVDAGGFRRRARARATVKQERKRVLLAIQSVRWRRPGGTLGALRVVALDRDRGIVTLETRRP